MSQGSDEDRGSRPYLFAGFASLFASAFLDNARGPVLPVLCRDLGIPYETAGQFLMMGCLAAVLATFALGRLLPRIGDRRAAMITCWVAVTPGLLAPFVHDRFSLLALGLLLGACVSLVGSLSSILTLRGSPVQGRGRYVSMQQVMYGIGSLVAPLCFSALIRAERPWWWLFSGASVMTFILGLSYSKILPKEHIQPLAEESGKTHVVWDFRSTAVLAIFAFYVAGEVLASMWMNALLVGEQQLKPEVAAQYQLRFFLIMGLTRFLCFLLVRPRYETQVQVGCLLLGMGFALLGQQGHSWALPLIGILGPFFPLTMARVSVLFPESWKQILIYIYVSIQMMLGLMHVSVGRLADSMGIAQAFLLSPAFLVLALLFLLLIVRQGRGSSAAVP